MQRKLQQPLVKIRQARIEDLSALVEIENACFSSDILSRRSLQRFIQPGPHELRVAICEQQVVGYVLVLYRTGTSLARLYSIAVLKHHRGRGIAKQLLESAEESGRDQNCAFMRLEVEEGNPAAHLYESIGYRKIDRIPDYYQNHNTALRMEKRIYSGIARAEVKTPYYQQTTDFSCGPAALMMAMKKLQPGYLMDRTEELRIWRESTTIYMTSGLGGCSPHGLALSAWRRGFKTRLYVSHGRVPFISSVRDAQKKAVIELVHEDFLRQLKDSSVELHLKDTNADEIQQLLRSGCVMIALISTWRLNRNKAPHWVTIVDADDRFVYINDPDTNDNQWQSETDYIQVPIGINDFMSMACFGRSQLRCMLILGPPEFVSKSQIVTEALRG